MTQPVVRASQNGWSQSLSQMPWRRIVTDVLLIGIGLTVLAGGIRTFFFAPYVAPIGSILDSKRSANQLHLTSDIFGKDHLDGDGRAIFLGLKLPFVLRRWGLDVLADGSVLSRNDLVLFRSVEQSSYRPKVSLARVIAKEGEIFALEEGDPNGATAGADQSQEVKRRMTQPGSVLIDPVGGADLVEVSLEQIEAVAWIWLWIDGELAFQFVSKTP